MATLPDCPVRWLTYGNPPKTVRKLGEQGNKAVLGRVMKGLIPSRYECRKCKKDMLLVERKGTIDGFEWRCRVQSKENPHFVCRSNSKSILQNRKNNGHLQHVFLDKRNSFSIAHPSNLAQLYWAPKTMFTNRVNIQFAEETMCFKNLVFIPNNFTGFVRREGASDNVLFRIAEETCFKNLVFTKTELYGIHEEGSSNDALFQMLKKPKVVKPLACAIIITAQFPE
ncbi:hypothetical protein TNCV_2807941 [Trichonephila clavipes]|nr:hypothetical protein TNCV_2807941 [Trichonephila clavipes]